MTKDGSGSNANPQAREAQPRVAPPGPDLARLAHEIRTPLAAIAVLSEIMRDEQLGPIGCERYREYASDIHESAGHAMRVIEGYLEPGAQGSALPMDFVELDPAEAVTATVSALAPLADRAGVKLRPRVGAALPRLIADRRSIRQMLDNLIANALKYTPPGGQVDVSIDYTVGRQLVLTVADNGDGMTEADLARARAGAAAPEPIRRRSGGSGIGLPLVRALAAASGAEMTIESRLGAGTQVAISFAQERLVLL